MSVKLSCFVATGAIGAKGRQGGTGAPGRVNAAPYPPTATTRRPRAERCSGPVGEISLMHACNCRHVEQLEKLAESNRFEVFQLLYYSLLIELCDLFNCSVGQVRHK